MGKLLLLRWLLPSLVSLFVLVSPAQAAKLQFWRFETSANRLSFTTDGGVQPKAQLLSNPTRLVIDLPGVTLENSVSRQQVVGGAIREVRLGQLDAQTARIVVELANGYTLNPQQVQFRGTSPTEWTVQLPTPQPMGTPQATTPVAPLPQLTPRSTPVQPTTVQPVAARSVPNQPQTRVEAIEVRENGVVLKTSGQMPQIEFKRSQDGSWMTVDVLGAILTAQSNGSNRNLNRDGVVISQVTQLSTTPPVVRVTMSTPKSNQNWQARASSGGVAVWPQGSAPPAVQVSSGTATIRSIELRNLREIIVQADQPLNYSSGWDTETDSYGITFFSARLAEGVQIPQRTVGGPIIWAKVRQEDSQTFTLLVKPATRIEVGQIRQTNPQQLSLPLGSEGIAAVPRPNNPVASVPPAYPQPILSPNPPRTNPPRTNPLPFPPRPIPAPQPPTSVAPRGRVVVVVDPGHGGSDVGAVGPSGLREKDVVFPISLQVAQILEQNGVQAVLTRQDDRTVELEPRVAMANRLNATLFVSIHANAATNYSAGGVETYYYSSGARLAQYIQNSIMASFSTMPNRGVKTARFYVLRNTSMPSVLVETGFVTNNYDARILADPSQQYRMAAAIAQGILQYLRDNGY